MSKVPDSVESKLTPKIKWLTSISVFLECMTFGCSFNIFGPSLTSLKNQYDTDVESISRLFMSQLIGFLIGSLTGGVLFNRVISRQLGVIISLSGMATTLILTPHCPTLTILLINGAFLGFFCGSYDTAQTVWLLEMWQSKSGPFVQAQSFCYAVGSIVSPSLVSFFLGEDEILIENMELDLSQSIHIKNSSFYHNHEELPLAQPSDSRLSIPFTIVGCIAGFNALCEIILFTCFRYEKPPRETDETSIKNVLNEVEKGEEQTDKKSNAKWYKLQLIIISGFYLGFYAGMEICSMQFIPTLAHYGDLHLTEAQGALVLTGLTIAFACGRALGILITMKVSPLIILCCNFILVIFGNVTLLLWANSSYQMLWVGCIALGLGFSTTWASFLFFMERHLVFTDFIGSVILTCCSLVAISYPWFVSKYIEENPVVVTYTNFLSSAICLCAFLVALFVTRRNAKKSE